MAIVKYGQWVVDVDLERTKRFYADMKINGSSRVYRNFAKYCESLDESERAFFDSLAINPLACDVEAVGCFKKMLPCSGHYYVFGKYISAPTEVVATVDELIESDFSLEIPDPAINAGIFRFDFQNPANEFCDIPDDMPEGCICINFFCDEMPWLLAEKCRYNNIAPVRFWEFRRKLKYMVADRKCRREDLKRTEHEAETRFLNAGIHFEKMNKNEVRNYKREWLKAFAPHGVSKKELSKVCLAGGCFLWHLFSYKFVEACNGEHAQELFDNQNKSSAVLIDNVNNLGYRVTDISALTSAFFEDWIDVTVTSADFSWTFSKTHEATIGPYYYKK